MIESRRFTVELLRNPLHRSIIEGADTEPYIGDTSDLQDFFTIEQGLLPPSILEWGVNQIARYREAADAISLPMVDRKILHTRNVQLMNYQIAQATGLDWNMRQANSIAFLHDLGRFPQALHYKTFKDGESFDHAQMSAQMVAFAQLPFDDDCDKEVISAAIAQHSQLETPEDAYARLIRDADKMVIIEEFIHDQEIFFKKGIHPECIDHRAIDQFMMGQVVGHNELSVRPVNRTLQRISWMYDLNFGATRQIAVNQRVFDRLFQQQQQLIDSDDTQSLEQISNKIQEWKEWVFEESHAFNGLYAQEL